jgi:signal transduction histidine kinase
MGASSGTEFAERREAARSSVLRANRAVMVILAVVFVLGVGMVAVSFRASQSQRRAKRAEAEATERLWSSYLAQARAERLSTEAGHRAAALAAISNAAAIRPSAELRDEALSSLGLRDLVREVSWPLKPGAFGFYFDPGLEHYVVRYAPDQVSMFRLADNVPVRVFRAADAGLDTRSVVKEFIFSLTGRYVVVQYTTGELVLWERDTGRPAHLFGRAGANERLSWRPTFAADDRTICARSTAHPERIVFIQLASGARREVVVPGVNESVRLNSRGDILAWYRGNALLLHDARTGALQKTITWPADVMSFRWDWMSERISVWCRDGTLHVLDLASGRTRQMGGKVVGPWVQQFSPDGTMLATAGHDGTSRLWDVTDASLLAQTREARAFTFGRDNERIAFAIPGREVGMWRISKPRGYRRLQGVVGDTATVLYQDLSPDGRWAVWSPPDWMNRKGFELFDLASNRPALFVPDNHTVRAGFHPTEPKLIVASQEGLRSFRLPTAAVGEAIQLGSPEPIQLPQGFQPRSFSFSADGRRAVVLSAQGGMVVLDRNQPDRFTPIEGRLRSSDLPGPASTTGSGGLAMSADGRWVVAGRETTNSRPAVWDAQNGKLVLHLDSEPVHVAFSPDGRWLVGVGTGFCSVWDAATWKRQWQRPRGAMLTAFGAAAFTPDGSLMAFARSVDEIELADPATGGYIAAFSGPNIVSIAGLRLAAHGRTLAAPSSDGLIHVWDLSALRGDLARWHLDWSSGRAASAPSASVPRREWIATPALFAGIGLGAVGLAGLLGMIVLRRHGRLTRDFVHTTELAAQQARELAVERELNELKSRFVSMVSHEFRTPLGITMSAVELLRNHLDLLDAAKSKELLEDIFSSTRHMAGLMEQVLVLGRVEASKLALRPAPIDLEGLCQRLVDESLSATHRRCPIQVKAEADLSGARADESLLRHIFSNLLSNAVKYSAAGAQVELTIGRDGTNAVFTVRDRGIGIPEADLSRLYQAFHRATNVGDTPGTGLGLVIVKRCVELHGGNIEVQSKPGDGTTFTVRLPLFASR